MKNSGFNLSDKEMKQLFQKSKVNALTIILGSKDKILSYKSFGKKQYQIFDLASITKLFTSTAIMKLIENKKLTLDTKLNDTLSPIYSKQLTVEHLLRHTSGFKAGLLPQEQNLESLLSVIPSRQMNKFKYSDINFLLLGKIVEKISKHKLDHFLEKNIFANLSLQNTSFTPSKNHNIAPTTVGVTSGVVHDPTSQSFEGITGHAGIFSSAIDLAKFASIFLNKGEFCGHKILSHHTVKTMTSIDLKSKRGLGFDIASAYSKKPRADFFTLNRSFGHTGFTGTSLWIDPLKNRFIIFLSNSTYSSNIKKTKASFYELLHQVTQSISR